MALGICTSLAALQAQLLLGDCLSAHPSLGMDWICQITNYIQVKRSRSLHHVPRGQECSEGSLESIPFHCQGRREITGEKP